MNKEKNETHYNFKELFKYIVSVLGGTIFTILVIIVIFLLYYCISVKLYATKGDKYEPKFSIYTIGNNSMSPTINKLDGVLNIKVDKIEDVKINDVITFISSWQVTSGMTITHRVVGRKTLDNGEVCLVTRGDNNTIEDATCVKKSEIIGITKAVLPGLGKIQLFLSNSINLISIILIPLLCIIIKEIFISKNTKEKIKFKKIIKEIEKS